MTPPKPLPKVYYEHQSGLGNNIPLLVTTKPYVPKRRRYRKRGPVIPVPMQVVLGAVMGYYLAQLVVGLLK